MDVIAIEFYDHTENCPPCLVRVVGELVEEDDLHWKVYVWRHLEHDDIENECYYSVLKSTATKVVTFGPPVEVGPIVSSLHKS